MDLCEGDHKDLQDLEGDNLGDCILVGRCLKRRLVGLWRKLSLSLIESRFGLNFGCLLVLAVGFVVVEEAGFGSDLDLEVLHHMGHADVDKNEEEDVLEGPDLDIVGVVVGQHFVAGY